MQETSPQTVTIEEWQERALRAEMELRERDRRADAFRREMERRAQWG